MIKLYDLNDECIKRKAASERPAQLFCRLFGNSEKPCFLNKLCKPAETSSLGINAFYLNLTGASFILFVLLYWLIKLLRLSTLLEKLLKILLPPVTFLINMTAASLSYLQKLKNSWHN
ncbi:MAG: hypothetical protein GX221_07650 [Candidatus Riflebacteria bacterium]|nr:hypothetical protein [Candidatus Riflebacteria bacterium]